jgi:RNA polymerase sigma-70 factor (sigma-E family)
VDTVDAPDARDADDARAVELAAFIEAQHPALVRAMTIYLGDQDHAHDIAQEALARVCRDWPKVRSLDDPAVWARRIAFNLANSHFRRRKVHRRVEPRLAAPTDAHEVDHASAIAVRAALRALPHRARTVLVLRYYEGMSVDEIASVLRCPPGTVKSLASRAIRDLRASGLTVEADE